MKTKDELYKEIKDLKQQISNFENREKTFFQTELALVESEILFRTIVENAPIMIDSFAENGNCILWNEECEKQLGYTEDEIVAYENPFELFYPDENEKTRFLKFQKKTDGVFREYKVRAKNGTFKTQMWADFMSTNGSIISIGHDFTTRKKMEHSLTESEEKYKNIVTLAPIGFYQSLPNGEIIIANDTLALLLGFDSSVELKETTNMKELYFADERKRLIKKYDDLGDGKVRNVEVKFKKKDGTLIWILLTSQAIKNEHGTTKYYDGFVIDITNIKNKEEEIQNNLEEKNLLLRELYHRTKNNMQVIASMLKIQGRLSKNETLQKTIQEIVNKIISMSMVHQKLYEAGNLTQIDLKEYIEDFVVQLMRSYKLKSNAIKLKLQLEKVQISIDSAVPLGLVISELVSNIYKHAFPTIANGKIFISLQQTETGNIKLSLSDNGVGVCDGKDLRDSSNMGLKNVFSLVEYQLRGKVEYHVENGLHWNIEIRDDVHKKRI